MVLRFSLTSRNKPCILLCLATNEVGEQRANGCSALARKGMLIQTNPESHSHQPSFRKMGVVRNVLSNWGSYAVAMGVNFFLSPYIVRRLGDTGYGVWTLILALTGYLGLLDLGIRGAVTRYVARFHAQGKHDKAGNVASSALVVFSSAGVLAILASLVLATFVVSRMNIPAQYLMAARVVSVLTGLSVAVSLVNGVFGGIVVGLQRFDLTNSIEVVINILRAATIVLALHLDYGIVTLAFIQLGFTIARCIEAKQDESQLHRIVLFGSRAGTMVMLPIAMTFMLRGSSFIGLWMGPQYAELSGRILWILSITLLFWAGNAVNAGILLGLSKHKPIVPVLLAEGFCNLALSVIWVKRMGILGVAWGTVVPSLCSSLIFWPWYTRRTLGVHPLAYLTSAWIRPAIAIVPFALGSYLIEHFWPVHHLLLFFLQVALVLPLAIVGYSAVCLDQTQRKDYSRKFSQSLERAFARG